jgi:hypothetical protein
MTLLDTIIQGAVESSTPLPDLLRSCKVLAARLQNDQLLNWLNMELEGYPTVDLLPDYRCIKVQSYGNFYGAFGLQLKNALIPPSTMPDEFHEGISNAYVYESVSALESIVKNNNGEQLKISWPADLIAYYGDQIYQNMICLAAWRQISLSTLVGILDTIRSRLLNFALELEKIDPQIGSLEKNSRNIPPERVSQIVNTVIMGSVERVSIVDNSLNLQVEVTTGDIQSLKEYIIKNGVSNEDAQTLVILLEEMKITRETGWSTSLNEWFSRMILKAASGSWEVGVAVAANVLTTAITKYLGLP